MRPTIGRQSTASGNTVHDNTTWGIYANDNVLVSSNTVYGHDGTGDIGIYANYGAEVIGNNVSGNTIGIQGSGGSIQGNRVFDNDQQGIFVGGVTDVLENHVYSNLIGIQGIQDFHGLIKNNLVYANSDQGILVADAGTYSGGHARLFNNTVYQIVGDAVRIEASSRDVELRNNILWVEAGFDIFVDPDSQTGLDSDRNLFHQGVDPNAHVGYFGGAARDLLADWQAASGTDPDSLEADPLWIDPDGADNVLGYVPDGGGFDGGGDDNFFINAGSPAIDRADSITAASADIDGFARSDDPGTPNLGSDQYFENDLGANPFSATGTAQNFHYDNNFFTLDFTTLANPAFTFPFYGTTYASTYVSSNGFLQFGSSSYANNGSNTLNELLQYARIAPLWDDLTTIGDGDVYVDDSLADRVTIRWDAANQADASPVNVAVTLWDTGRITFDYGAGNTNLTPTVGISRGDGQNYLLSTLDGSSVLTDANTQEFVLLPGFADIGAYEFRGSSLDVTPPMVVGTNPVVVHNSGTTKYFPKTSSDDSTTWQSTHQRK